MNSIESIEGDIKTILKDAATGDDVFASMNALLGGWIEKAIIDGCPEDRAEYAVKALASIILTKLLSKLHQAKTAHYYN